MDNETKQILSEAEALKHFVKSEGWAIAKRKWLDIAKPLFDIGGYNEQDPYKLMAEIGANQQAIKIMSEWFSAIEADAENYETLRDALIDKNQEDYININN